MAWTSKSKDISIASTKDHPPKISGLVPRPPGIKQVTFTPAEFFGAAARCCHLHVINPALVTPESAMIKALVEQHVDDTSADFAVLATADRLKDFLKSHFAGAVASGLAYLAMIQDGYVWADHFENIGGGNPTVKKSPDFVFVRAHQGDAALVESKGTRSTSGSFNSTVRDGYADQVEPHLGHTVGTSTASHGYCIGSDLSSVTKGELNVHYTGAVPVGAPTGPATGPGTSAAVQLHDYATAFQLAHSDALGRQVRQVRIEQELIPFLSFEWLGRRWLTGYATELPTPFPYDAIFTASDMRRHNFAPRYWGFPIFAIDSVYAFRVLGTIARLPGRVDAGFDLAPFDAELSRIARIESGGGAAIFPDGLASFTNRDIVKKTNFMLWNPSKDKIVHGAW